MIERYYEFVILKVVVVCLNSWAQCVNCTCNWLIASLLLGKGIPFHTWNINLILIIKI